MAKCMTCGQKAGFGSQECTSCYQQRLANQQADANRLFKETVDGHVASCLAALETQIQGTGSGWVYSYISIDQQAPLARDGSYFDATGSPTDLSVLQMLAARGWEVVSVIPRTAGNALTNVYQGGGSVWGAGLGGLVVGATVLIRLPVTADVLANRRSEIVEALSSQVAS
jgi:hypothetical protein